MDFEPKLTFELLYSLHYLLSDIYILYRRSKRALIIFKRFFGGRFILRRRRFIYHLIRFFAFIIGLVLFIIGEMFLVLFWISFPAQLGFKIVFLFRSESFMYLSPVNSKLISGPISFLLFQLVRKLLDYCDMYWNRKILTVQLKVYDIISSNVRLNDLRRRRKLRKDYDMKTASTWITVYTDKIPITIIQNELNDPCAICYEEVQKDLSQIRKFPCNHIFHTSCIDHWFFSQWALFKLNWTCPLCFSKILDCE